MIDWSGTSTQRIIAGSAPEDGAESLSIAAGSSTGQS
jgi:hypothetical protein